MCFPVKFLKFFRTLILKNISEQLLLDTRVTQDNADYFPLQYYF